MNRLLSGRNVLVVEDEILVLMALEDMLSGLGCASVSTAVTVEKALALLDHEVFDAALLDVDLNGSKSDPVAEALALRGIPFAFSTGYRDSGARTGCAERPVLKKPYRYEDVVEILTRLLPHHSSKLAESTNESSIKTHTQPSAIAILNDATKSERQLVTMPAVTTE